MASVELKRDRRVTRYVHKLYWRAMVETKLYFVLTVLMYPPAFFCLNILIPYQIAYCIQAIITRNFGAVGHYAWLIIIITLVGNVILAIGTWAFNRDGTAGGKYIQNRVFHNYLSKDYEFYGNSYIGALGTQAASIREAFITYNRLMLFDIVKAGVVIIAGLSVVAVKSLPLAGITLACMLLVFSFTIVAASLRLKYRRLVSRASSKLAGVLGDALSHASVVKSFSNEHYETKRLSENLRQWEKTQLKSWDLFTPVNFGRNVLLAVTMGVLLVASGHLYQSGKISIAIIALVQLYVVRLINTTLDIANIIKEYEATMSSAYQPAATMMLEPAVKDVPEPKSIPKQQDLEISFEHATYRYPEMSKKDHAVADFSLKVSSGQKVGLVGYSGSGKTTLTKLLLRFMDLDSGAIKLNNVDISQMLQEELRKLIAYVPQEPLLFHRSIRDNIAYAKPEATSQEVEQAGKLAFVDEFVSNLPKGYDTMVGERGVKLSGGQRQRVAIARALLKNAPILVLDEATSALDSQSEHYIQKALKSLMTNHTSIVIAHRLSTIQNMDKIVVMDKAKIVEAGTHTELLKNPKSIYAKLWGHQSGGYIAPATSSS